MAGLGESCSHIAALLFAMEANTQLQKKTSCTSLPCSWLPPSFQDVEYAQLADIDFTSPQVKRRRIESGVSSMCAPLAAPQVESPSAAELNSLYKVLFKVGQPVALSLVLHYSESFIPLCTKGVLPKPLTELYRKADGVIECTCCGRGVLEICENVSHVVTSLCGQFGVVDRVLSHYHIIYVFVFPTRL